MSFSSDFPKLGVDAFLKICRNSGFRTNLNEGLWDYLSTEGNILRYSEDLTSTYWEASPAGSVTATANDAVAPDGTTTAEKIVTGDTLSNGHGWFDTFPGAVNTVYCFSLYMKAGEYTRATLTLENTAFAAKTGALFDLSNGTVVSNLNNSNPTIESVGDGWYRCSVSAISDADGGNYVTGVSLRESALTEVSSDFTPASVGLGHYVWGAQVNRGSLPRPYTKTEASSISSYPQATLNGKIAAADAASFNWILN
jgi:hypothetical protein